MAGFFNFFVHLSNLVIRNYDLRRLKRESTGELNSGVANELAGNPEEGLFKVVVALCTELIVLQRLLTVEGNGLCLDLAILDVDFVSTQDNWNVLANSDKVTMPLRNVLVRHARSNIEHNDCGVTLNTNVSQQNRRKENGENVSCSEEKETVELKR